MTEQKVWVICVIDSPVCGVFDSEEKAIAHVKEDKCGCRLGDIEKWSMNTDRAQYLKED